MNRSVLLTLLSISMVVNLGLAYLTFKDELLVHKTSWDDSEKRGRSRDFQLASVNYENVEDSLGKPDYDVLSNWLGRWRCVYYLRNGGYNELCFDKEGKPAGSGGGSFDDLPYFVTVSFMKDLPTFPDSLLPLIRKAFPRMSMYYHNPNGFVIDTIYKKSGSWVIEVTDVDHLKVHNVFVNGKGGPIMGFTSHSFDPVKFYVNENGSVEKCMNNWHEECKRRSDQVDSITWAPSK